jgi:hypothetical protein
MTKVKSFEDIDPKDLEWMTAKYPLGKIRKWRMTPPPRV